MSSRPWTAWMFGVSATRSGDALNVEHAAVASRDKDAIKMQPEFTVYCAYRGAVNFIKLK